MTSRPAHSPTLRHSTVLFMAASTGMICANMYYIQPLLADVARGFHISSTQIGAVAMLSQIGTALGMLFFVPLGDSHERRSLITTMILAAMLALLLTATAQNPLWLALACFGVGMTGSTVHLFVPFAAHMAPPEERGRVVGTVFSGVLMGVLLARTFSGVVGAHLGWRAVYVIAAALMLGVLIFVQFLLPRSTPTVQLSYFGLLKSTASLVLEHQGLREAGLIGGVSFGCFSAFWTTLVFFLERPPYHYGAQTAGLFGLVGAAGAAGAPLIGRLTDRRGARFTIGFCLVCLLLSYVILALAGWNLIGLIAGVLLLDFGTNSCHVANLTRIYALAADAKSRLNMFYMVCSFVGGALGSIVGAYSWRLWGWPGVCGSCIAVLALALLKFTLAGAPEPGPATLRQADSPVSDF